MKRLLLLPFVLSSFAVIAAESKLQPLLAEPKKKAAKKK